MAAAHLDADGVPDLVTANYNGFSINTWCGSGNGTFTRRIDYPVGQNPPRLAVADVNGDGWLDVDVAVANSVSKTVNVLLVKCRPDLPRPCRQIWLFLNFRDHACVWTYRVRDSATG